MSEPTGVIAPPRKFLRELAELALPEGPAQSAAPAALVTEADVAPLPEVVRRYLTFMEVLGRPRDWSFRVGWTGRFRRSAADPWMATTAWQYNSGLEIARIFHLTIKVRGLVPVFGRDTYLRGKGRMHIRALDLVTVQDGQGREFDIGELVTFLNDAIMIAPSMLLGLQTDWHGVDERSFDVSLTDGATKVSARVFVDDTGAPVDFRTRDRFVADPPGSPPARHEWSTPIAGWRHLAGRPIFTSGSAKWLLPSGELPYAELAPVAGSLAFNVPPGS